MQQVFGLKQENITEETFRTLLSQKSLSTVSFVVETDALVVQEAGHFLANRRPLDAVQRRKAEPGWLPRKGEPLR